MKSEQTSNNAPGSRGGIPGWLLPAMLIVGAAGMAVTGTLLWMESRPSTPAPTNTAATMSTPATPNSPVTANAPASEGAPVVPGMTSPATALSANESTPHPPPPALTAGMTPAQAALMKGNWYYDHKEWLLAIENYRSAIAQGIDNPDVRTDYGSSLRFGGQPKQALEQYLLAQKQNPNHEFSLFNQGGLYATDLKQPAKGIAIWREYIKRFPNGKSVGAARQLIAKTQG